MNADEAKIGRRVMLKRTSRYAFQSREVGTITESAEKERAGWWYVEFPALRGKRFFYPPEDLILVDEKKERCSTSLSDMLDGVDLLSLKSNLAAPDQVAINNAIDNELKANGIIRAL